jgi:hypothetical protein
MAVVLPAVDHRSVVIFYFFCRNGRISPNLTEYRRNLPNVAECELALYASLANFFDPKTLVIDGNRWELMVVEVRGARAADGRTQVPREFAAGAPASPARTILPAGCCPVFPPLASGSL